MPKSRTNSVAHRSFGAYRRNPFAGWVDLAVQAGVGRIVLNGSFVTDIMELNDVDYVLLASPILKAHAAEEEIQQVLPFLE